MIEGPGPPGTVRLTAGPSGIDPTSLRALIRRSDPGTPRRRDTQRILLLWVRGGGEKSVAPHTIAPISPFEASTNGIRGLGLLNPVRAQVGSRRVGTRELHAVEPGRDDTVADPWAIPRPNAASATAEAQQMTTPDLSPSRRMLVRM
jgi:hypothetical protein